MFKKLPLLLKEHNRNVCKNISYVLSCLHNETYLCVKLETERNLTFVEAFIPSEVKSQSKYIRHTI